MNFTNEAYVAMTSNNQRLESAFDDLDPRFSLLCQVGDDVIRPEKSAGGGGGYASFNVVPYKLDSNLF